MRGGGGGGVCGYGPLNKIENCFIKPAEKILYKQKTKKKQEKTRKRSYEQGILKNLEKLHEINSEACWNLLKTVKRK